MLPTRFTFDGQPGSDPWWDFQLDGYGTWLWAVHAHAARHEAWFVCLTKRATTISAAMPSTGPC